MCTFLVGRRWRCGPNQVQLHFLNDSGARTNGWTAKSRHGAQKFFLLEWNLDIFGIMIYNQTFRNLFCFSPGLTSILMRSSLRILIKSTFLETEDVGC